MPTLRSRWPAPALLVLLVAGCASAPPQKEPPPAPAITPPTATAQNGPKSVLQTSDCPPTPPMPKDVSTCGDGLIGPRGYEFICAPCIPGRCCTCGWGPTSVEACDGANLGGKSCASIGFIGGTLRCKADCSFDTSACTSVSGVGELHEQRTGGEPPRGRAHALLASNGTVQVAASDGSTLRLARFDLGTLSARGGLSWTVPAEYDSNRFGLDRLNNATQDTLGDIALAGLDDGQLIAVQRFGKSGTLTFRATGASLSGPLSMLPNARPLFLVAGKDGALLGIDRGGLQLVKVGRDGVAQDSAVRDVGPIRQFGNEGAAAYDGQRWVVAGLARYPNDRDTRMVVARVGDGGELLSASFLAQPAESAAIALGDDRSWVAFATREALLAVELLPSGKLGTPETLASGTFRVLAAEASHDALSVYATARTGELIRFHRPRGGAVESTTLLSLPGLQVERATLSPGTLAAIYSTGNGAPALFVAH